VETGVIVQAGCSGNLTASRTSVLVIKLWPWAGIAQTVQRLATDWTVRGSNPGGGTRFSPPVQTGPGPSQPPAVQWRPSLFLGDKAAGAWR